MQANEAGYGAQFGKTTAKGQAQSAYEIVNILRHQQQQYELTNSINVVTEPAEGLYTIRAKVYRQIIMESLSNYCNG